jgi:hypothetical protein
MFLPQAFMPRTEAQCSTGDANRWTVGAIPAAGSAALERFHVIDDRFKRQFAQIASVMPAQP